MQAFPSGTSQVVTEKGMTLHDWYVGKVLQGIMASASVDALLVDPNLVITKARQLATKAMELRT